MKAIIKEIELDCECMQCGSNSMPMLNDVNNQSLEESLEDELNEGWLFKQDSRWADKAKRPSAYRELFAFCSEECYLEWLKENKYTVDKFIDAELNRFVVNFDHDLEVSR